MKTEKDLMDELPATKLTSRLSKELYNDMATPRYQRAKRFADTVLQLMQDFVPRDRRCMDRMYEHLLRLAYEQNVQLINVPPEWDEFNKLQIEKALLKTMIDPVVIKKDIGT